MIQSVKTRWSHLQLKTQNAVGHAKRIWDYSTDGCTGVPDFDFEHCCGDHDFVYRNGTAPRWKGDWMLKKCMDKKGWTFLPWVYWAGVRLLGWMKYDYQARRDFIKYGKEAP